MNRFNSPLSRVREASPFATPPHIVVLADDDSAREAVELVEALDGYGADAEVRIGDDAGGHYETPPDAVIIAGPPTAYHATRHHPLLIGGKNGEYGSFGFDITLSRPFDAAKVLEQLGGRLSRAKL